MEAETLKLTGVINARIDFASSKMFITAAAKEDFARITREVRTIVKKVEPDVGVVAEDSGTQSRAAETTWDDEHDHRGQIIKLVIGGAIFAVGIIMDLPSNTEMVIYLTSYIILGSSVIARALQGIFRGRVFSEHFLMSIATIGAFLVGAYPEGVAVMLFYLVGEILQDLAVDHSRRSISALMDIRPDYANLKLGNAIKRVTPQEVTVGDLIVVKPGEKVPLDGRVSEGRSMVDTSALTGESVPREIVSGQDIFSGFINKNGVLTIQVTKNFGESTVSRILDLVQNASSRKAPTENFITKFARYYTPAVVVAACGLAFIPPLVMPGASFSPWFYRALVFLVVSCPCALVISIPLGFFGGIGGASKRGILVKGSNYLEALNSVETVVFDKTGTLTKGVFKVTSLESQNGFRREDILEYAALAESYSNHPIALSIIAAYGAELNRQRIQDYQEITGQGMKVQIDGREVLVGNSALMSSRNIDYREVETLGTAIYVALEHRYAGCIIISDEVKEDAAAAIRSLKALGIQKTVMMTGDLKKAGDKIGAQLGLDEVYSELLPADKVVKLEQMIGGKKSPLGKIVFVGDGINDAPVLARADIGMAMGGLGSDAAIEAADIVIMTDEPSKIATAIRIARRTRNIVYQNIVFAMGVKAVFLVLGAAGVATMWEAVFGDMGVALLAIFNAMRIMNTRNL